MHVQANRIEGADFFRRSFGLNFLIAFLKESQLLSLANRKKSQHLQFVWVDYRVFRNSIIPEKSISACSLQKSS